MTTRRPTARERIADWTLAYHVMLEEMTVHWIGKDPELPVDPYTARSAALAAAILVANAGASTSAVAGSFEDSLDG
jgi:hypothetical protein